MKLIVVSYEDHFENELDWLQQLFEAGLYRFHLRKPNWSKYETIDFIHGIDSKFHPKIVLHDHPEILQDFNLAGFHVNRRHQFFGDTHSESCHSYEEVSKSEAHNYVFLSPIFDSISKRNYTAAFLESDLKTFLLKKETSVIALGGVTRDKVEKCKQLGFDGVAVLGAIWKSKNPLESYKEIQKTCQESVSTY